MEIGSKKRIKFRVGVAAIGANLYQDKVDGVGESLYAFAQSAAERTEWFLTLV